MIKNEHKICTDPAKTYPDDDQEGHNHEEAHAYHHGSAYHHDLCDDRGLSVIMSSNIIIKYRLDCNKYV